MKYDDLKVNLNNIIDNSESVDKKLKGILKNLFENLADYDKERLNELEEIVRKDIYYKEFFSEKFGNIVTALVSIKDEYDGFSDIKEDFPKDFIGAFFKCSYEEFLRITDNNPYKEYEVIIDENNNTKAYCRLEADSSFIEKEKCLYEIAEQYNIDTPVIFSPYARKFAKIVFNDESIKAENIKYIKFEKNIDEFVIGTTLDSKLIWNLKVEEKSFHSFEAGNTQNFIQNQYFIPNEAITQKKELYKKCKENQFIIFHGINDKKIGIGRNIKEEELYVLYDDNMNIEPYAKITINDVDEKVLNKSVYYRNCNSKFLFNLPRIRTKSDILYVVNAFNGNPYDIRIEENFYINKNGSEGKIEDYEFCHRYYYYMGCSETLKLKNTSTVCLNFTGKDKNLTEDYARYVLSFLNKKYPEFYWIGRYSEK